MTIESNSCQILVRDSAGQAGVNVNRAASGYVADLYFWGGTAYLATRADDPFIHVLVAPSERWLQDLRDESWIIVGTLKDLAATPAP